MKRLLTPLRLLVAALLAVAAALLLPRLSPWPVGGWLVGFLYGTGAGCTVAAVLRWWMPDACHAATPALQRRYLRELMPAMAGYVVAIFLSVWLLKRVDAPGLRVALALLPVPPIALALRAIVRYIRDVDEMQQRIELEAVSIATALVSLLYLSAGLLQRAKAIDIPAADAMTWVFPLICVVYGVTKIVVSRRFR